MTRQPALRRLARRLGVGRALLGARDSWRLAARRFRRDEYERWRDYWEWRYHHGRVLAPDAAFARGARRALVVTKGNLVGAKVELALIKGLELGGFTSVVATEREDLKKFYRLAGVREFVRWDAATDVPRAAALVAAARSLDDLVAVEHAGARVGKFAVSTTFRSLRVGRLDLADPTTRQALTEHLALGMARAAAAVHVVRRLKPQVALFRGNRYTGHGELMDVCLREGVDVLTWYEAHRSSALMLKRYHLGNRDWHHGSLSDATWARLRALPWTDARRQTLWRELHDAYAAGDWYSRGGTQVDKPIVAAEVLRRRLGLDPARKTAVVFPHVVWDATLFWGRDLFLNYEDWLVETVRAACANPRLNWIVKIHPVHVHKQASEFYEDETAELAILRARIGPLPAHVQVIPPETDVNTYSLFGVMDYCLTVRGTIGIEAACHGIRVLTAGTGRYDRHGFTVDSNDAGEYLERLAALDAVAPMTAAERELAERFAYGAFVARPLPLTAITIQHDRDNRATRRVGVNARSAAELRRSPDLVALGAWLADGRLEDFLWEPALAASAMPARRAG